MSSPGGVPSKLLLVEGDDDESVVWHLNDRSGRDLVFEISKRNSVQAVLGSLATEVVARDRVSLGVVVDANSEVASRWQSIGDHLSDAKIQLPGAPDPLGTVVPPRQPWHPTVGIWMMPDNVNGGELEDFVGELIPEGDGVWPHAQNYVSQVPVSDRPVKPAKAAVHAWLAVRTEGKRMGTSIRAGAFDLQRPAARVFLDWLQRVFN